jgi:iron complex transport system substrate-binding protein
LRHAVRAWLARRRPPTRGLHILAACTAAIVWCEGAAAARVVVDSAGRQVEIPDRIERVIAAGPPASVLVYVLAPEKLIGWNRKPPPEELPFLSPSVRNLPEIGRLTGRGGTMSLEAVLALKPDLIVDFGSVAPTYVSLADRVQAQTGIPYVLLDGQFANTGTALRLLGEMLGVGERSERLARYAEETLGAADRAAASVPAERRPRVYLARGPRGLETARGGSLSAEIIERAGAVNVVDTGQEVGSLFNASLEQILGWNPDTIVTLDRNFFDSVRTSDVWGQVGAVRRGRVFLSPSLPYGWIDSPPSLNRLIGLQWMTRLLFPGVSSDSIRDVARDFYRLFYQVELSEAELDRLLVGATLER